MTRQGLLYFGDEGRRQREILERLPPRARAAFAVSAAERALRQVEGEGGGRLQGRWRDLVDAIWESLGGNESRLAVVRGEVSGLETWLAESNDDPPPDLAEVDVDHVAAALYAAQALITGSAQAAGWAAGRAIDIVFVLAESRVRIEGQAQTIDLFIQAAADPDLQDEVRRQRADLDLLVAHGVTSGVLQRLRS